MKEKSGSLLAGRSMSHFLLIESVVHFGFNITVKFYIHKYY